MVIANNTLLFTDTNMFFSRRTPGIKITVKHPDGWKHMFWDFKRDHHAIGLDDVINITRVVPKPQKSSGGYWYWIHPDGRREFDTGNVLQ
jgi:hypothetical protein